MEDRRVAEMEDREMERSLTVLEMEDRRVAEMEDRGTKAKSRMEEDLDWSRGRI